jgi:hypothetical protein
MTDSLELDELRTAMSGPVLDAMSPGYDEARKVWNADHDRRPALIARCGSTADVVAAVNYARERGLEIAVRGGGHSPTGASTVDDGMLIDLRQLNRVTVDPSRGGPWSAAAHCWPSWTPLPRNTGWPCRSGSSGTPGSAG